MSNSSESGLPAIAEAADRARPKLHADGFAVLEEVFSSAAISVVETLLDQLFVDLEPKFRPPFDFPFARDMQPGPRGGDAGPNQPEIIYAAALQPLLLDTEVFRTCAMLAEQLGGAISRSFDHAIYKMPLNPSVTPWHQDAAFATVRPSRSQSLSFWIPLQDVSQDNGCMEYVAGSHRGPVMPHDRYVRRPGDWGYVAVPGIDDSSRRVACPVMRRSVVVHTPYTLHYAGSNMSERSRKVWIIRFSRFGTANLMLKRLTGTLPAPLGDVGHA